MWMSRVDVVMYKVRSWLVPHSRSNTKRRDVELVLGEKRDNEDNNTWGSTWYCCCCCCWCWCCWAVEVLVGKVYPAEAKEVSDKDALT